MRSSAASGTRPARCWRRPSRTTRACPPARAAAPREPDTELDPALETPRLLDLMQARSLLYQNRSSQVKVHVSPLFRSLKDDFSFIIVPVFSSICSIFGKFLCHFVSLIFEGNLLREEANYCKICRNSRILLFSQNSEFCITIFSHQILKRADTHAEFKYRF